MCRVQRWHRRKPVRRDEREEIQLIDEVKVRSSRIDWVAKEKIVQHSISRFNFFFCLLLSAAIN